MNVSQKQYILSSKRLPETSCSGMTEQALPSGVYLYSGEGLSLGRYTDAHGRPVILLGHAFCTDTAPKCVGDDIARWDGVDTMALTRYWTGRWALLTEQELCLDAGGLMSGFYHSGPDGWTVSSSLALLATVTGSRLEGEVASTGLTWRLLPRTLSADIQQMFCTQKLRFSSDTLTVLPQMWITDERERDTADKCRSVADMLTNAVINMHRESGRTLLLALTSGKDSRLVLAALCRADVPFEAYTAEHGRISKADRTLPARLASKLHIPYTYVKRRAFSQEREQEYEQFTGRNSNGADKAFYAYGQFSELPQNALVIRSGLFEAGQTYGRTIAGADVAGFCEGMRRYYRELERDDTQQAALNDWLRYIGENPCEHVDIRDRFYVEQRVGGWAAAIEQSLDMNDFVSIQIANCAALLSVLLSYNEQERKNLALTYETIRCLQPELLRIPINPLSFSDRCKRLASVCKKKLRALRH